MRSGASWPLLPSLLLAACSGGHASLSDDGGSGDDSSSAEGGAVPCAPSSSPSTLSFDLATWPALTATTATDLTAQAGVTTTSVAGAPAGVLVTKDGSFVMAATSGGLVVLRRQGTALIVDHTIPPPANETPFSLAASPDGTMVAVSMSDEVGLYDRAKTEAGTTGALLGYVPTHSVQRTTIDVAFSKDSRFAFAALEYDGQVAVVDTQKQAYVGAIPIAGNAVTGVVLSPDGTRLYVTTEEASQFAMANPSPAQDQNVGTITVVDAVAATTTPSTAVLGTAFVGRAPVRSAVSPDGSRLWVTARGSNAVIEFDVANLLSTTCEPRLATVAVGPAPVGLTFTSATRLAVANSDRFAPTGTDSTVMLLDATNASVLGQIAVGSFPREMDSDGMALFVSNYASQSIGGIDLTKLP
jgi:DNA-binding beta-propeller fold protein YncE